MVCCYTARRVVGRRVLVACDSGRVPLRAAGAGREQRVLAVRGRRASELYERRSALARRNAPSILFIDEIDAMVGSRDAAGGGQQSDASVESRVLSTLLNEMDGISSAASDSPLLMAATNRLARTRRGADTAGPLRRAAARAAAGRGRRGQDILKLHVGRMAVSGDEVDVAVLVERTR